jgi:nitroreductase
MKIRIRERARELGIPVLMDTSDRGLLDVERFDREPGRPLLHGLVGDLTADALGGLTTKEKIPYVVRILDVRAMSATAAASMIEINETISSWPQLGSAVTLGGALIADVARRILLDTFRSSGRFYVDLAGLVHEGGGQVVPDASPLLPQPDGEALRTPTLFPPPRGEGGPLTRAELRYLVGHAALAPSAGNNQPWQFSFRDGALECRVDTARAPSFLDASHFAIGAAIENLSLAASASAIEARVSAFPEERDGSLVCRIELERGTERIDPLFSFVTTRVTNRRLVTRVPFESADAEALRACARDAGASLAILTEPDALDRIARVMGAIDRLQLTSPTMHRDAMAEMRWSPEEALATRTGLDVSSLELTAADLAAMRVAASWSTMAEVDRIGGGRALEERARIAVAASSCVVLASIEGGGPGAYFAGGRAVQRVWLECTRRRLALQPYSASVYLFARLQRGGDGLAPREVDVLRGLRPEFERCFPPAASRTELLLFRLSYAEPPRARSLRLGVDAVLTVR